MGSTNPAVQLMIHQKEANMSLSLLFMVLYSS